MPGIGNEQPWPALTRVTELANAVAEHHPDGRELVKRLFDEFAQVLRQQYLLPQPIETAPKQPNRKLLLFCPKQDGWQVGEWAGDRWLSTWRLEFLDPTHWAETPPEPRA
jgi:hypothetical protein